MARVWGGSWGESWGDAWGSIEEAVFSGDLEASAADINGLLLPEQVTEHLHPLATISRGGWTIGAE